MNKLRVVRADLIRPVIGEANGNRVPGLEVLDIDGDRFVIVVSGDGLQNLQEAILELLQRHPELQELKTSRTQ